MSGLDQYRAQAKDWLEAHAAEFGLAARKGLSIEDDLALGRRWMATKYDAGYCGIAWPKEHGGQGLSVLEKLAFEEEETRYGFPTEYFGISLGMPIPILLLHGPENWKVEKAIAAMRGEEIWCQLFSEPGAGSDLAGLRTKAVQDGEDWIINGQKLWTSYAQYSDYGVIVTRSDPSVVKHKGLTYFWLDMRAPGVTVRPLKLAAGDSHVNEVFFDDVRISDKQRMGAIGGGFAVAMQTLFVERYSALDSAGFGPTIDAFVELAKATTLEGRPAIDDLRVRQKIAQIYALRSALEAISQRSLSALKAGKEPGPEGSLNKLISARSRQRLSEYAMDLQGVLGLQRRQGMHTREDWGASWIGAPTSRIAGGSDEMLLNTIAEKILGLPQDHRPDKGVPFNQL